MLCPKCGYLMDALDKDCPRCARMGYNKQHSLTTPPEQVLPVQEIPPSQIGCAAGIVPPATAANLSSPAAPQNRNQIGGGVGGVIGLLVILYFVFGGSSIFQSNSDYTVRVSGTPGIHFSGNYGAVTRSGSSDSKTVDGTTPAEYTVSGNIISAVMQKQDDSAGALQVDILKDGTVVKSASTTAAYGCVTVCTQ